MENLKLHRASYMHNGQEFSITLQCTEADANYHCARLGLKLQGIIKDLGTPVLICKYSFKDEVFDDELNK